MKKTFLFALALVLGLAGSTQAQKFGYCNSALLLAGLPEVKAADSDLQAFQAQLQKKGQEMVKAFQAKAEDLQRRSQEGTISPKESEEKESELRKEQEGIQLYEQQVYTKISEKRETLYKPILERVNTAMREVADANGFLMVFDKGTQILLYVDPSLDVTPLVKTKLGIN
jgi:outer membrane protein